MPAELIADNFAGGGGASTGIEDAVGRSVDVAINHDPRALAVHSANHRETRHFCESIFDVDPVDAAGGRPVGLAWFSPDCTHFSRAKGGKPVDQRVRGLAWVVIRWARAVAPRVIFLENVEEFETWGPLDDEGYPIKDRAGETFHEWVQELRAQGYAVEWRSLSACDFGTPTTRKRLFLIARRDGRPIVWPDPSHGPDLAPYRTAAECIDWSLPCPSIFGRKRPLAPATMARIANGVRRYVLEAEQPFLMRTGHWSHRTGQGFGFRGQGLTDPLATVCATNEKALVVPSVVKHSWGSKPCHGIGEPLHTVTTQANRFGLVASFLAKHYGGVVGHGVERPIGTVTPVDHHSLVAACLAKLYGSCRDGQRVDEPLSTVTAGGNHHAQVAAFLTKYYGRSTGADLREPLHTSTARARFGLVMVAGVPHRIVDIGMRMLQPRELFTAQGFPHTYVIDPEHGGRPLAKRHQVRMAGNSVCPDVAAALVRANYTPEAPAARRCAS